MATKSCIRKAVFWYHQSAPRKQLALDELADSGDYVLLRNNVTSTEVTIHIHDTGTSP